MFGTEFPLPHLNMLNLTPLLDPKLRGCEPVIGDKLSGVMGYTFIHVKRVFPGQGQAKGAKPKGSAKPKGAKPKGQAKGVRTFFVSFS